MKVECSPVLVLKDSDTDPENLSSLIQLKILDQLASKHSSNGLQFICTRNDQKVLCHLFFGPFYSAFCQDPILMEQNIK